MPSKYFITSTPSTPSVHIRGSVDTLVPWTTAKKVWVQIFTGLKPSQMGILGSVRGSRGLAGSPSKAVSSVLASSFKTSSPLCLHNKLLWQESFQVRGMWFPLMWSTFQRAQLLTILVNEIVLQFLAAQPQLITWSLSSFSFSSGLTSVLTESQTLFGLAHSLRWQPSNHLQGLFLKNLQGTSRRRFGEGSPGC